MSWAPDNGYITTGKTKLIDDPKINVPAGFFYGNYDGLSKPPTFDLQLDGGFRATVDTSASEEGPIFQEILYNPKGESTSLCLVRTHRGEIPFISSLVVAFLPVAEGAKPVYKLMGSNTALHLVDRTTFGGLDQIINSRTFYNCDEYSFRIWRPKAMPGYLNVSSDVNTVHFPGECLGFSYENRPPDSLLKNAITPSNAADSISVQR
ncbi:hypothetical protein Pint_06175 [Pistacia integerrima]|uniref:Uncharacterized protein n=1 Tax=Pistacia integerrima TaxID=434235 RepID=A0ACC0ZAB8_9ROSI|nr:hypothetical protein Pint_06175 [Pistacia integerrima]